MKEFLCTLGKAEDGATAVEYVLMVSLIAMVIIASITSLGVSVHGLFDAAAVAVSAAVS